jgi:hypothetical protein
MIEKPPITSEVSQIVKCATFRASRTINGKHDCRGLETHARHAGATEIQLASLLEI